MQTVDEVYEEAEATEIEWGEKHAEDYPIDINNLHSEEQVNSELYFKYHKIWARSVKIVNALDSQKKQKRSELIRDCIQTPALCDPNTKKYTDKKAEAYYRTNEEYIAITEALNEAIHNKDMAEGMRFKYQERKWALKDLVSLAMSEYFESKETKQTRKVFTPDEASALMGARQSMNLSIEKKEPEQKSEKQAKTTRKRRPKR